MQGPDKASGDCLHRIAVHTFSVKGLKSVLSSK